MADYVAAIEQGTTNTRCSIFDRNGQILAYSQKEHRQIYLLPDRVEQQPLEIWKRVQEVIQEVYSQANLHKGKLTAVGIANQRETTIVWDRQTGMPYYNAIVWQDTRTKEICKNLIADGLEDLFQSRTGLPLATYFSGPKIKWILDNVSGVREAANRGDALFGTVDSWLIWWLTGGPGHGAHVIDATNASRTLLFNLETLDWDEDLLHLLTIPRQMLPRLVPSSDPMTWGTTSEYGPFGQSIPICGDLGDQQAALVGQACYQPGEAKCSFSTACFILLNTGTNRLASRKGLLTTIAYRFGKEPVCYALEGSISFAEALVRWLRDNLGIIRESSEIETLAQTVKDNGSVTFVPPANGLVSPYWNADAISFISGITPLINKGHVARAALETIAYQVRRVIDAMREDFGITIDQLKVDGGMACNNFLMGLQADILGIPVTRPKILETALLGTALAAGLASGFWNNLEELKNNWQEDRCWLPHLDQETRDQMYTHWLKINQETYLSL